MNCAVLILVVSVPLLLIQAALLVKASQLYRLGRRQEQRQRRGEPR